VPLRYFVVAQAAFLTALFWAPFRVNDLLDFYYEGHILALTHLLTLGWITMAIMGAAFQLVPIALETTLYSQRLARWQFWLMLVGITAMVGHFWVGRSLGMAMGAGFVLVGVALFLANMGKTLWQVERWDIAAQHVAAALVYLAATALLGTLMALDKIFDLLGGQVLRTIHAHAHLAGLGWISMMLFGMSYRLAPMFSLGDMRDERTARWQFWLLNGGILGVFLSLLLASRWLLPSALVIAAAIGLFLRNMLQILRAGRRPRLDWGLRNVVSAMGSLAILTLVGLWLSSGLMPGEEFAARLAFGYGAFALLGWISIMVVGMTYKMIPFLVWHHRYSDLEGSPPVPSVTQFLGALLPRTGCWLLHAGTLITVGGLVLESGPILQAGTIILSLAGAVFALGLARIYRHLFPSLTPLSDAQASKPLGGL
jgi:hypothetical protein